MTDINEPVDGAPWTREDVDAMLHTAAEEMRRRAETVGQASISELPPVLLVEEIHQRLVEFEAEPWASR